MKFIANTGTAQVYGGAIYIDAGVSPSIIIGDSTTEIILFQ